jgi:hypothetical protein
VDVKPQLKIIVVNAENQPIYNATVQLYQNESDWKNLTNPIAEESTNQEGVARFKKLEEKIYFFYVEKDNLNNRNSIASHNEPLKKNMIKTFTVTLQ